MEPWVASRWDREDEKKPVKGASEGTGDAIGIQSKWEKCVSGIEKL